MERFKLEQLIKEEATVKAYKNGYFEFLKLNDNCRIIEFKDLNKTVLINGKRGNLFRMYPIDCIKEIKKDLELGFC